MFKTVFSAHGVKCAEAMYLQIQTENIKALQNLILSNQEMFTMSLNYRKGLEGQLIKQTYNSFKKWQKETHLGVTGFSRNSSSGGIGQN